MQPEFAALQRATAQVAIPNAAIDLIEQLRRDLVANGIIISDRRWGQALGVLQAHALAEGRDAVFRLNNLRGDLPALEVIFSTV